MREHLEEEHKNNRSTLYKRCVRPFCREMVFTGIDEENHIHRYHSKPVQIQETTVERKVLCDLATVTAVLGECLEKFNIAVLFPLFNLLTFFHEFFPCDFRIKDFSVLKFP